jgi:hypothetical protein
MLPGDRTCVSDRAVLLAPGILSPRKDHRQGRARGRVAYAMAQAPPLTLIFHGKTSAPIGRTDQLRLILPHRLRSASAVTTNVHRVW